MKKSILSIALALSVTTGFLGTTANAASGGTSFKSTIPAPATPTSIQLKIIIGDELAYRATHVSPKMRDRHGFNSRRSGWSGQGKNGQKELDKLAKRLEKRMIRRLKNNGMQVNGVASHTLTLTITDARPNRPTFTQLSSDASLSMQSYGIGGAKFTGVLTNERRTLGDISYGWYETSIRDSAYGSTWTDANRAIDRFARKAAKSIR